jgi:hypothetical protein
MWPHLEAVLTPTIVAVINEEVGRHPDDLSFIQLVPLIRHDGSRVDAA